MTRKERYDVESKAPEHTLPSSDRSPVNIIHPTPDQLAVLLDLAKIGDIAAIHQQCDRLVQQDPRLKPFAAELNRFAQDFHLKPMRAFLAAYASDTHNHAEG